MKIREEEERERIKKECERKKFRKNGKILREVSLKSE